MPKRRRAAARPCRNGVKLRPHGVLTSVFPPELVDRVVDEAGAREQRACTLPARVVVYYLLAMVLFCQSGYVEVRNKLVSGRDWARRFQVRLALGMQPSPAAITYARKRAGWQVMRMTRPWPTKWTSPCYYAPSSTSIVIASPPGRLGSMSLP